MLLKTKFLLSLVAIGVAGGTGVGVSYLKNEDGSIEKEEEIKSKAPLEGERNLQNSGSEVGSNSQSQTSRQGEAR